MIDTPAAPGAAASASADAAAAGALLRQLREAQGLHIAALATAIKVTPAKLEALEAGRLAELPDLTFARALAQTVCRALKADAAPVLARMPGAVVSRLERVDEGLNAPMPERGHGLAWGAWPDWAPWRRPVPWLAALLLLAAAAFLLLPRNLAEPDTAALPAADAASQVLAVAAGAASTVLSAGVASTPLPAEAAVLVPAVVVPAASAPVVASVVASAPAPAPVASAAGPVATATSASALQLRALQDTWVQVQDAHGRVLAARTFTAGETVAFDGPPPLRLRIGNVAGTELLYQGRPVDLSKFRRDNVAALSLP